MLKKTLVFILLLSSVFVSAQEIDLSVFEKKDSVFYKPYTIKIVNLPKNQLKDLIKAFRIPKEHLAKTKIRTVFPVPTFWDKKHVFGLSVSEVAFVNWNAGGTNSVSALGNFQFVRNYKGKRSQWNNEIIVKYGINSREGEKLRKTNDEVRLNSTFGYRKDTISRWFYSVRTNFRTQISDGFKYPNRDNPISRFMAPGYFFLGAGAEYSALSDNFSLYISPVTQKTTFVLDDTLANQGAFGVKKAVYDTSGNLLEKGNRHLTEIGILIENKWTQKLAKNVTLKNTLSLYTDYINSFGNIDVDWQVNIDFVVNNNIKAQIGTHTIFDDDIRFDEVKDANGNVISSKSKIQFKQLLGIGLNYSF